MADPTDFLSSDAAVPALRAINDAGGPAAAFSGDTRTDGSVSISGNLIVGQDVALGAGASVGGALTVGGAVDTAGLQVRGGATFERGVNVARGLEVGAGASVAGGLTVAGEIDTNGLRVRGGATFERGVNIARGLDVSAGASFGGSVEVGGDIMLRGADCAEYFAAAEACEPGSVVVIDPHGLALACRHAADTAALGVVAGAGEYKTAIHLDAARTGCRVPVAMFGKVYCKVDASFGAVRPGDLLTTSPTEGHAMRARHDRLEPGTVVGKALATLDGGQGLLPVLVYRQ